MEQAAEGFSRTAGVPPGRVGAALAEQRQERGLTRRAAAERAGLDVRRLKDYELGRARIPDGALEQLSAAYEVPVAALLPARSTVRFDAERASLEVGALVRKVHDPGAGSYAVLKEYLDLVYELRNTSRLERIPLRDDDLDALADALGGEPEVIEQRLMELMDITHEEAMAMRRVILRRRLAMPAAGLMMSAGLLTGFEVTNAAGADGRVQAVVHENGTATATEPIVASGPLPTLPADDGEADDPLPSAAAAEPPAPEPAPAPPPAPEEPVDDVDIGTAIVQEYGDEEPTVLGDESDAAADEEPVTDVDIGTAIVQEYGDEEPTVRE